eukprot:294220-Rhodomonas_salina.4
MPEPCSYPPEAGDSDLQLCQCHSARVSLRASLARTATRQTCGQPESEPESLRLGVRLSLRPVLTTQSDAATFKLTRRTSALRVDHSPPLALSAVVYLIRQQPAGGSQTRLTHVSLGDESGSTKSIDIFCVYKHENGKTWTVQPDRASVRYTV